jgi:hypothetical protein
MTWQATTQVWGQADLSMSWHGASAQQSMGAAVAGVIGPAMSRTTLRSSSPHANPPDIADLHAMMLF